MNLEGIMPLNTSTENRFQYNGKELEKDGGIDLSDYGARWYDASVGRFMGVDPLVEKYSFQSPYAYATNNPVLFRDILGMGVEKQEDDFYFNSDGELISRVVTAQSDRFFVMDDVHFDSEIMMPVATINEIELDSDLGFMARTIYAEGAGQSQEAKVALGEVIRNRAHDSTEPSSANNYNAQFSNVSTYEEVVTQSGQFESVGSGSPRYTNSLSFIGGDGRGIRNQVRTSAFVNSMGAAIRVDRQHSTTAQGATHFFSPYISTPSWVRSMTLIQVQGVSRKDFRFYKY